jgi:hypothetical protein
MLSKIIKLDPFVGIFLDLVRDLFFLLFLRSNDLSEDRVFHSNSSLYIQ